MDALWTHSRGKKQRCRVPREAFFTFGRLLYVIIAVSKEEPTTGAHHNIWRRRSSAARACLSSPCPLLRICGGSHRDRHLTRLRRRVSSGVCVLPFWTLPSYLTGRCETWSRAPLRVAVLLLPRIADLGCARGSAVVCAVVPRPHRSCFKRLRIRTRALVQ